MLTNQRTAKAISACLGLYETSGRRQYATLWPVEIIRRREDLTESEARELLARVRHTIAVLGKVPVTMGTLPRPRQQTSYPN